MRKLLVIVGLLVAAFLLSKNLGDAPDARQTAAPSPTGPAGSSALFNARLRSLELALVTASGNVECGYSEVGYGYHNPADAARRWFRTMQTVTSGDDAIGYALEHPDAPWQVVVTGDDEEKEVRIEGYGGDLSEPLMTRKLDCP